MEKKHVKIKRNELKKSYFYFSVLVAIFIYFGFLYLYPKKNSLILVVESPKLDYGRTTLEGVILSDKSIDGNYILSTRGSLGIVLNLNHGSVDDLVGRTVKVEGQLNHPNTGDALPNMNVEKILRY